MFPSLSTEQTDTLHRWEELEEKPAPGQWTYFERH